MENSAKNENNIPSGKSKEIIALIIKYGTFALILEEGCNSVFRTDKYQVKFSILKYFIEKIKFILQKNKDEDIRYNSLKKFIDYFIFIIDRKKINLDSENKYTKKKIFGKSTNIEKFIREYSSDEFKKYKTQFIEIFNEYKF